MVLSIFQNHVSSFFPQLLRVARCASGGNQPITEFGTASWDTPVVYTKDDSITITEKTQSPNQYSVSLIIQTRILLQATNSTVAGTLTIDAATVAITEVK